MDGGCACAGCSISTCGYTGVTTPLSPLWGAARSMDSHVLDSLARLRALFCRCAVSEAVSAVREAAITATDIRGLNALSNHPIHTDASKRGGAGLLARVIGTR